jgi:anaphase-promoting complex subunit 6
MVLKRDDMHERELRFKYLAARCLAECKDWEECLSLLGDGNDVDSCYYDKKVCRAAS